jgi:hypothetical protein
MRLLLSGSEINHPDKSDNLFYNLVKISNEFRKDDTIYEKYYDFLINNGIIIKPEDELPKSAIIQKVIKFDEKFYDKSLAELRPTTDSDPELDIVYNKSILEVNNTA